MSLSAALISVDVVAFRLINGQLHVLAQRIENTSENAQWMLPAGKIDQTLDHSLDDTANRQLQRLTNKQSGYMEQVATLGDNKKRFPGLVFNRNLLRPDGLQSGRAVAPECLLVACNSYPGRGRTGLRPWKTGATSSGPPEKQNPVHVLARLFIARHIYTV